MSYLSDYRARQAREAAEAKAAANGQPDEPTEPAAAAKPGPSGVGPYVETGVAKQLAILREARPGTERTRNTTLYVSAKCLAQLGVDRKWLRRELLEACEAQPEGNGLIDDDGDGGRQCRKTIASGYLKADKDGPREYDAGYIERINVEVVPMSVFEHRDDVDDLDDTPEPAVSASLSASTTAPQSSASPASVTVLPTAAAARAAIFAAEADFWDRDSLQTIYDSALMKMTPPWGVLAYCAARALHRVGPAVQLAATIGGYASLNWFGAAAAPSAGGKSSAGAVAANLVKGVGAEDIRNIGSGEGIAGQYRPSGNPSDHRTALMFICPEIDTLAALNERNGSITRSVLCNVWMGDPPGLSYVKNQKITPMGAHEYRATLIVGVQPGLARTLLEDHYSGMLQRFQWFPAFDDRCTRARAKPGQFVYALPMLDALTLSRKRVLDIPPEATEEILTEGERRAKGLTDAFDGHMLLARLKFAFALAVLDERDTMNLDDWRRAGIAIEVSKATRTWCEIECREAEAEVARQRAVVTGVARSASDEAKAEENLRKVRQCAGRIKRRLQKGAATRRELQIHTSMSKGVFELAIAELLGVKAIERVVIRTAKGDKDGYIWV